MDTSSLIRKRFDEVYRATPLSIQLTPQFVSSSSAIMQSRSQPIPQSSNIITNVNHLNNSYSAQTNNLGSIHENSHYADSYDEPYMNDNDDNEHSNHNYEAAKTISHLQQRVTTPIHLSTSSNHVSTAIRIPPESSSHSVYKHVKVNHTPVQTTSESTISRTLIDFNQKSSSSPSSTSHQSSVPFTPPKSTESSTYTRSVSKPNLTTTPALSSPQITTPKPIDPVKSSASKPISAPVLLVKSPVKAATTSYASHTKLPYSYPTKPSSRSPVPPTIPTASASLSIPLSSSSPQLANNGSSPQSVAPVSSPYRTRTATRSSPSSSTCDTIPTVISTDGDVDIKQNPVDLLTRKQCQKQWDKEWKYLSLEELLVVYKLDYFQPTTSSRRAGLGSAAITTSNPVISTRPDSGTHNAPTTILTVTTATIKSPNPGSSTATTSKVSSIRTPESKPSNSSSSSASGTPTPSKWTATQRHAFDTRVSKYLSQLGDDDEDILSSIPTSTPALTHNSLSTKKSAAKSTSHSSNPVSPVKGSDQPVQTTPTRPRRAATKPVPLDHMAEVTLHSDNNDSDTNSNMADDLSAAEDSYVVKQSPAKGSKAQLGKRKLLPVDEKADEDEDEEDERSQPPLASKKRAKSNTDKSSSLADIKSHQLIPKVPEIKPKVTKASSKPKAKSSVPPPSNLPAAKPAAASKAGKPSTKPTSSSSSSSVPKQSSSSSTASDNKASSSSNSSSSTHSSGAVSAPIGRPGKEGGSPAAAAPKRKRKPNPAEMKVLVLSYIIPMVPHYYRFPYRCLCVCCVAHGPRAVRRGP